MFGLILGFYVFDMDFCENINEFSLMEALFFPEKN